MRSSVFPLSPSLQALALPLMLAVLSSPAAQAASSLQVSGFGSFAVSHDDGRGIALQRDLGQPVPETRDYSFRSDSILGLKTGYRLSPTLEFGGQVVLRDRVDFKAGSIIEGAHLNWHPSERVAVRGGRMGLDVFMLSDYRSVGYAQPWVRPPREFYGWIRCTPLTAWMLRGDSTRTAPGGRRRCNWAAARIGSRWMRTGISPSAPIVCTT